MKKLLIVILLISSISYSFYSFSSDKDNKKKIEEVYSFIPFKTQQEFSEEQKKITGKKVQDYYKVYIQWYNQRLKNNENFAYQEYLKKCLLDRQEFKKHLPQGLRKDIGNIVQGYLCLDFKQWQENNKQLLDYAATYKVDIKLIQELLESGDVNINSQDEYGDTALTWAVSRNDKELVRLLLEKGANVNTHNQHGTTALMIAQIYEYKDIAEMLNKFAYQEYLKKPHPAKQEFEKHLPEGLRKDTGNIVQGYLYVDFQQWQEKNKKLLDAAKKGNIQLIQELLGSGDVDINTQDHLGRTALKIAQEYGNKDIVEILNKNVRA